MLRICERLLLLGEGGTSKEDFLGENNFYLQMMRKPFLITTTFTVATATATLMMITKPPPVPSLFIYLFAFCGKIVTGRGWGNSQANMECTQYLCGELIVLFD